MSERIVFITGRPDLYLIAEGKEVRFDHAGRKIGTTTGKAIQFKDRTFVLTEDSAKAGGFESMDEARQFLVEHRLFNLAHGFFSETEPPNEPKPSVAEQMRALTRASVSNDPDAIQAVIEAETATHNRVVVLSAATSALEEIASKGRSNEPVGT